MQDKKYTEVVPVSDLVANPNTFGYILRAFLGGSTTGVLKITLEQNSVDGINNMFPLNPEGPGDTERQQTLTKRSHSYDHV